MKTVKLTEIQLNNFMSHKSTRLSLDFDGSKLLIGINEDNPKMSNGTGKTTIAEAIVFCLTGRTLKGLKGDDIIMEGKDFCQVGLNFKIIEGDKKRNGYILAGRNPNKVVFFDGIKKVKAHSIPEMYKKIQEFFGFDYEILTKFFIVGEQESFKFSFLGSEDSEQKKLLTKMTNSEIVDKAFLEIKCNIAGLKEMIQKGKTVKHLLKESVEGYEDNINILKKKMKALSFEDMELEDLLKEKRILNKKSDAEKRIRNKHKRQLKDFEEHCEYKVDIYVGKKEDIVEKIKQCEKEISGLKYKEEDLLKDKGKTCPNCGYNIGKENEKELVVVRKKCDDANVLLASLYREQNNLSHLISTYQNPENLKKHKRIESFISEYEDKESEMLQKLMNNHQRIETVRSFKAGQSQALKEQKKKIEKDLRKTNIEIERTQKVLEIRTKKLAYYKSLLHHFGKQGFKNYLFGMKLKLIEATVNDFLVRSESEMYLKLDGMKKLKSGKWVQKISSKIYKEARFRTFESLSKGERRRIDLAFIFAFGKLLNFKINFLFRMLDEPFGGLDYKGKKKVIEMMKNLEIPNVVITPENKLGIYYEEENIITIYMKNAISSLER